MKNIIVFLLLFVVFVACGKEGESGKTEDGVDLDFTYGAVADSFFRHPAFDEFGNVAYLSVQEIGSLLVNKGISWGFDEALQSPCDILREGGLYVLNVDTTLLTTCKIAVSINKDGTTILPKQYLRTFEGSRANSFKITNHSIDNIKEQFFMCRLVSLDKGLKGGCIGSFELIRAFELEDIASNQKNLRAAIMHTAYLIEEGRFD